MEKSKVLDTINTFFKKINETTEFFVVKDHTCCNTCGFSEIYDALEDAGPMLYKKQAYAFYHLQETANMIRQIEHGEKNIYLRLAYEPFCKLCLDDDYEICVAMYKKLKKIGKEFNITFDWSYSIEEKFIMYISNN